MLIFYNYIKQLKLILKIHLSFVNQKLNAVTCKKQLDD